MATLEKHVKERKSGSGLQTSSAKPPKGRTGRTEQQRHKQDYSEQRSRDHGKMHPDCKY